LILLFILYDISYSDDSEKYVLLREQCARNPSNSECVQLKTTFLNLIQKCQNIKTQQQVNICLQVKAKLCAIFPTLCGQTTKKILATKKRTSTKSKLITTTASTKAKVIITTTTKPKVITPATIKAKVITPATTKEKLITTTTTKLTTSETINNEEFAKVPVNPDELRTRGEYCVRHGKEKKCQELLNNLKTTYSSCGKKKAEAPPTKPEELDCHSFQTHMCVAFPKFPPCIKKTPKLI
jgi:hypothetical protein